MSSGHSPGASTAKVAAKGADDRRYCAACGEKLSAYNPGPNCYTHTVGIPWRGPTAKPK